MTILLVLDYQPTYCNRNQNEYRAYLKNNLKANGGVVERFKLLSYYVYAPLFHRSTPYPEP